MAFNGPGRIQSEELYPKELVMYYLMKCFFLGKMLSKARLAMEDVCQDRQGQNFWKTKQNKTISGVNKVLSSFVSNHKNLSWWFDHFIDRLRHTAKNCEFIDLFIY